MENNLNNLLEKDATPADVSGTEIVEFTDENQSFEVVENNRRSLNNNMVLSSQTNSSAVLRFDNCHNVTLGNVFNVGGWLGNQGVVANPDLSPLELRDPPYSKTPTIKAMMESTDLITPAFLEILSGYFGARWKEVTILLQINQLFVERMFEDYNERGGTKEVLFQILTDYFKNHEEKARVGWIITYLWRNKFKKTVWSVKEPWKQLRELEKELEKDL